MDRDRVISDEEWKSYDIPKRIAECRRILAPYPENHSQRLEIEKQIKRYEDVLAAIKNSQLKKNQKT